VAALRGNLLEAEARFLGLLRRRPADYMPDLSRSGFVLAPAGHLARAVRQTDHAVPLIPFHAGAAALLGMQYAFVSDNRRAEDFLEQALTYGMPTSSVVYSEVRALLDARARRGRAAADATLAACFNPDPAFEAAVRLYFEALGDPALRGTALDAIHRLIDRGLDQIDVMTRKRFTLYLAQLGDADGAVAFLSAAVTDLKARGFVGAGWGLLWLTEMREVQRHPGFIPIARELGLIDYWKAFGPPDGYLFDGERLLPRND
jgi:tetratricopeptide (TPR) repeat protein